jgi:hypothetical protein
MWRMLDLDGYIFEHYRAALSVYHIALFIQIKTSRLAQQTPFLRDSDVVVKSNISESRTGGYEKNTAGSWASMTLLTRIRSRRTQRKNLSSVPAACETGSRRSGGGSLTSRFAETTPDFMLGCGIDSRSRLERGEGRWETGLCRGYTHNRR